MSRLPLSRLTPGFGRLAACFCAAASAALFAPIIHAASPGGWSDFQVLPYGAYVGAMEFAPGGQHLWLASSVSAGGINPVTNYPYVRSSVRLLSLSDGVADELGYEGLDNSEHDGIVTGLALPRLGDYPVLLQSTISLRPGRNEPDHSPYLYHYDAASGQWSPAGGFPSGEQASWPGPPSATLVRDDLGDLLVCGNHRVFSSADGVSWTQRSDLNSFFAPPPPYQPAYGASGLPAWLPPPQLLTNQPLFQIYSPGWQTGFARMPWGELFVGGEQGSYFHSLDNGLTWQWFDPLMSQPIRDAQGRPLYRHPRTFRLAQTFGVGATGDGEVMLNCKNNLGHHFFVWNSTGQLLNADAGLPAPLGSVEPGICQRFVTDPASGETFMVTRWTDQKGTLPTPTGRSIDCFRWDGAAWSLLAPPAGFECEAPGVLLADATGIITPARETANPVQHHLLKWTPDLASAPPPVVAISGGDSATAAPSVALSALDGRASLALSATVAAANAFTCQWSARGPGPVLFDDARAVSPRARFSVVGDYVLNLRATDSATGAHRGASVIVHVRPAPGGGSAPVIATQPANTVIAASGSTSFALSVVATGPGPFTYQWKRDGRDVVAPSARTATLTGLATAADLGALYHCVVGNPYGTVASHTAQLGHAPVLVASPVSQTVAAGQNAVFGVSARGAEPMTWQWRLNGSPIANATRAAFAASAPGAYSVTVTNVFGSVTSSAATLANGTPSGPTAPLQLLPGEANAPSGGDAYLNDGTPVPAVYPLGQPIPLAVERTPYGYGPVFIRWDLSGLAAGHAASFASSTEPQTALTVTGPGQATSFRVTAVYKDAAALPFHALSVVNGYGTGEYREAWNHATNASAGAPVATIEALPAPPGRVFDRWTGGAAAVFADARAPLTTVTLPAARTTVTANYIAAVEAWRAARFGADAGHPAIAGDAADPDGDGRPNLLEYALGLDPLATDSPAAALLPALAPNPAASGALEFTFTRDLAASDATCLVQVSDDLFTWTDASAFSAISGDIPNTAVTVLVTRATANGRETITVRDTRPLPAGTRRFFRLRISHP